MTTALSELAYPFENAQAITDSKRLDKLVNHGRGQKGNTENENRHPG